MIDIKTTTRLTMRVDEVVESVGVSRRTVYYWVESEKVEVSDDHHGGIRIAVASLRQHLETNPPKAFRSRSVQFQQASA